MGEVYRARDTRLQRSVAIKILPAQLSNDPARKQRFEREAKTISSLNHPHICVLYDVGSQDGVDYLVMECVEGETLAKRLERGPLPLKDALKYGIQIADALDKAQRSGVVHRDLKPANIMLTATGAKLLDFGLAKPAAALLSGVTLTVATPASPVTQEGVVVGTFQYMSPEQVEGKEEVDARSDIFSFGSVLYEMVTGRRAFAGKSQLSVASAILEKEPEPISTLQPLAPPVLDRAICRCLAKDREERWQTARDLLLELKWIAETGLQAGIAEPLTSRRKFRDRLTWALAAVAILFLGALGGGWAVSRFWQPPTDERVLRLQIDPPPGGRFVLGGTTNGGLAISPDGRTAAYTASVNGKSGLWVRPLDGGAARLLPGTENAGQPFWSPDSKSIGFVVLGNSLRRVDPGGGTPVEIYNDVAGVTAMHGAIVTAMHAATWGSGGYILFAAIVSGRRGLFRIPASGGTPSFVTGPDPSRGELIYLWPQVLPEGRFLYVARGSQTETSGLYAASLAKPSERVKLLPITTKVLYASSLDGRGYLLWVRGGSLVAQEFNPHTLQLAGEPETVMATFNGSADGEMRVAASANGLLLAGSFAEVSQLTWVDRTGKPLRQVSEPMENALMFRLSPDERHITVQLGTARGSDLWMIDAERGVSSRLTASVAVNTQPIWSPDGRMILFTQLGTGDLLRKAASGVGDEQVIAKRPNGLMIPTDWSGDGRWVLTRETSPDTGTDIWKLPATPDGEMQKGAAPTPYLRTKFNESSARFSPEPSPRWVAYVSDESGQAEVYIDAFPEPRGKKRVSTAGGRFPQWGAGGRELFYVSPDNKLMSVSLKPGTDTIEPYSPHELFTLSMRSPAGPTYQPSRDGQRFLVLTSPEAALQPLTVIVNWPSLLKTDTAAH